MTAQIIMAISSRKNPAIPSGKDVQAKVESEVSMIVPFGNVFCEHFSVEQAACQFTQNIFPQ